MSEGKVDIGQVTLEIRKLKQKFINDVTAIINKCDTPIEVLITQRPDNAFYRQGQRHPFNLAVNTVNCHIGLPFVLGNQSILISQD